TNLLPINEHTPTDIYTLSLHDALPILEHDPNRGRGQAYRYDYGRELYGREAYRDNYRSSERDYRHSGPNYRGRGPKGYHRSDQQDRKSTRLNSSHVKISYAVFCLKKKK